MTTTTTKPGKQNTVVRAGALSAGTTKHYTDPNQLLAFGGKSYTVTQVNTNLQEIAALRTATTDAQAGAKTKVAAEKTQLPPLLLFMAAYLAFVKATFGNQPDVLADFGVPPKKVPTPLSPEKKAAAKAKRAATRLARGTTGSQKKKAIVGNVIGVNVTPITAPTAPAPQPAAPANASAPAPGANASGASGGGTTPHS